VKPGGTTIRPGLGICLPNTQQGPARHFARIDARQNESISVPVVLGARIATTPLAFRKLSSNLLPQLND